MGLKWFRARLSIKKEKAKIPAMMGLYRRVSHSELNVTAMSKNENVSNPSPTVSSDSTAIANNEKAQYDRTKADFTINEDEDYHHRQLLIPKKHSNHTSVNAEPSTSTKDLNLKEQSLSQNEESNNMNTEQNDNSDKSCSDNELVI